MRLGVSPAAAPTPTGVFNQRFEALFPRAVALGCEVCFAPCHLSSLSMFECGAAVCYPHSACPALHNSESSPLGLPVCECGATGSANGQTACALPPALCLSGSRHSHRRPLSTLVPVSAPPTGLDECLVFISLVLDFLAVRFSVSSGCARRRSVSTYAAILVLNNLNFFKKRNIIKNKNHQ